MFFVPLTVPLIQNLGILILQARNQMKFRSVLYIVIALCSLGLSIFLAQTYGGYGCAFATGLALLIGQGLIMNIYYQKKQRIDIKGFWWEILKMSIVPIILVTISLFVTNSPQFYTVSLTNFLFVGLLFTIIYGVTFWLFSMNKYEKNLIVQPFKKYLRDE